MSGRLLKKLKCLAVLSTCLLINGKGFASEMPSELEKLKVLIENNDTQASFELAERLFDEYAGEAEFDYMYAISARKVGKHQHAIFAFERAILAQPNNVKFRFGLAIAYFELDNFAAAKSELKQILALNPSKSVVQKVEQYLDYMDGKIKSTQTRLLASIKYGLMYDSNVTSGVENALIPSLFSAADSFVVESDLGQKLNANLIYQKPLTKLSSYSLSAGYGTTRYQDLSDLNKSNLDLVIGYQHQVEQLNYKLNGFYQKFWFGGDSYHDVLALIASLDWKQDNQQTYTLNSSYAQIDNKQNNDQDINNFSLGLSYKYRLDQHLFSVGLTHAQDKVDTLTNASQKYQRKMNAFQLSWLMLISDWGRVSASYQKQKANHDYLDVTTRNPASLSALLFSQIREDDTDNIKVNFDYTLNKSWQWQTQLKLVTKDSNHFFYSYDRNQFTTSVKYNFN
ncbi:porin family protein [Catenovulum maritimum]|uniref:Surface lipoprotein assembly modifier C-terminal domain-containing protein n=1 Tax=Catenovulum maritimum TaxID=1513271 RepID=A0A0J8JNI1_9ALTE|nr:porin family protein [Catenovulum maritimum]KMT66176.1 hypothetical protein XM47_05260 [Catenovulum maritimum]